MRAGLTSMPAALKRASVSSLGCVIATPCTLSGSTTMVAPPPVVVTTPTFARRDVETGTRSISGRPSINPSRVVTRAIPQSARNASATSSSPASAPVCDTASSRAASERPSL